MIGTSDIIHFLSIDISIICKRKTSFRLWHIHINNHTLPNPATFFFFFVYRFDVTDICSAEVWKHNHIITIINHVMDVFVWFVSCLKPSVCNFNSTGTHGTMIGYENNYKHVKEAHAIETVTDGAQGPGISPWDVTESFPACLLCFCTLCLLNRDQHHPEWLMIPTACHSPP